MFGDVVTDDVLSDAIFYIGYRSLLSLLIGLDTWNSSKSSQMPILPEVITFVMFFVR